MASSKEWKTWEVLEIAAFGLLVSSQAHAKIDRAGVVAQFHPHRSASSNSTPFQVGNGDFAFGVDVTGLQTFYPFNTLSTWCWHNSSLPSTPNQTEPSDFTGLDWWTHGRLVNYAQPNPAEENISQWLIGNPHRVNLGRVGLHFGENVTEADVDSTEQTLNLYQGIITSSLSWRGEDVKVSKLGRRCRVLSGLSDTRHFG